MRKYMLIAVFVIAIGVGLFFWMTDSCGDDSTCSGASVQQTTQQLTIAQQAVMDMQSSKQTLLIDVRTDEEWAEGHAVGAVHFELARLQTGELPDVAQDQPVYVYCRSGNRSAQATELLRNAGFTDVRDIGALGAWIDAGGAVEI